MPQGRSRGPWGSARFAPASKTCGAALAASPHLGPVSVLGRARHHAMPPRWCLSAAPRQDCKSRSCPDRPWRASGHAETGPMDSDSVRRTACGSPTLANRFHVKRAGCSSPAPPASTSSSAQQGQADHPEAAGLWHDLNPLFGDQRQATPSHRISPCAVPTGHAHLTPPDHPTSRTSWPTSVEFSHARPRSTAISRATLRLRWQTCATSTT